MYLSSKIPQKPHIIRGDLAYLQEEFSKFKIRNPFIITKVEIDRCIVKKFTDTEFRSKPYQVNITNCIKVPNRIEPNRADPESYSECEFENHPVVEQNQLVLESPVSPAPEILVGESSSGRPTIIQFLSYDRVKVVDTCS